MTLSKIEEQLAALEPMPDDDLAAEILCALETRHCPVSLPTQVFAQVVQPTQHTSCFASGLPLMTGIAGGLIGAAVMFFAVTFFMQPKVEIREVVRYVPVAAADLSTAEETQLEIKPNEPEPNVESNELPPKSRPQELGKLPWVLAWLYPIATSQMLAYNAPTDVDAMLEQRARLAKNAANMPPRPQLVLYEPNNSPPSGFSPIHYREMIEKMSL